MHARILGAMALLTATSLAAQTWTSSRPDGHAPIGVMGDHTHEGGEVMFSYRFMLMGMAGNRSGTTPVTDQDVLADFMVTPTRMRMTMHMAGAMLAPHDRVTLMAMLPIHGISMDHLTRMGGTFTTSSSGIGDVSLAGLIGLFNMSRQTVHLTAGASFPTGAITAMDVTPASAPNEAQLPYPMQLGSGTFDLMPGLTYLGQADKVSWGLQARGTLRLGENDRAYTLGNAAQATGWFAVLPHRNFSFSLRAEGKTWGDIEGADGSLNPMMVPTARPDLRGGTQVNALAGINFEVRDGALAGQRLAVEFGMPVLRDLHGPQLERDWVITAGWQYAFEAF